MFFVGFNGGFMRIFLTVLECIHFGFLMLISPIFFIPYGFLLMNKARPNVSYRYMNWLSRFYTNAILNPTRIKKHVKGLENLEGLGDRVLFVSNHESPLDVIVFRWTVPILCGFISKIELFRVPFLQLFMQGMGCLPLDRSNIRKSMDVIKKGAEKIKNGHPMYIFPEGTRNRAKGMRAFKRGSLKLAEWSKATIVPVTLEGATNIFTRKGINFKGDVFVTVHKPIDIRKLSDEEIKKLDVTLWNIVNSGFREPFTEVMPPKVKKK